MLLRRALCGASVAACVSAVTLHTRSEPAKLRKTYLVTGCSSGIGLELVRQLAARGDRVYATCRTVTASLTGDDDLSKISGEVIILPGVDVASDGVGETLKSALKGVALDCIVHNAGSFAASNDNQKLESVSMEAMRYGFELNTLGPLRVTQALIPQITAPGGKVVVISTMMGSIADNTSGGKYAYRTSKAAVNMVSRSMACDLKPKGIAVVAISPGFIATNFGGRGAETLAKYGAKPVEPSVCGIIQAIDNLCLDNTGEFVHANYGNGLQPAPW